MRANLIKTALLMAVALTMGMQSVFGIEAAYVPDVDGGGDYLVRVEPDLVRNGTPYTYLCGRCMATGCGAIGDRGVAATAGRTGCGIDRFADRRH
ncbi:MAG: hypothetical protein NTY17_02945 [Planctomycetia bacterium]|nr:hypothetical protein [Planctomycetia bacterium]